MAFDLLAFALDFIAQYGLIAIFVLLVLDAAMLMPILPGEIVMIMAVVQYADNYQDLAWLVALATAAAMIGSMFLYGVARGGGARLLDSHPRLFMMSRRKRERFERLFQNRLGESLVMFLRIIPLTRVLVNIPAGVARMPWKRFVVLSTIGMAIFHAGFMWLAFEFRRPDSGVAETAAAFNEAYGSPAWEYMQANTLITAAVCLALGVVLSVRASRRRWKDPEESAGSLVGWLTSMVLVWGGIAVGVALWVDSALVYDLAAAGGVDVSDISFGWDYEPLSIVAAAAAASTLLGLLLVKLRRAAKARHKDRGPEVPPVTTTPEDAWIRAEERRRGPDRLDYEAAEPVGDRSADVEDGRPRRRREKGRDAGSADAGAGEP